MKNNRKLQGRKKIISDNREETFLSIGRWKKAALADLLEISVAIQCTPYILLGKAASGILKANCV